MNQSEFDNLTLCVSDLLSFSHRYAKKNPDFDLSSVKSALLLMGNAVLTEYLKNGGGK